jgi:hypothetical protein
MYIQTKGSAVATDSGKRNMMISQAAKLRRALDAKVDFDWTIDP